MPFEVSVTVPVLCMFQHYSMAKYTVVEFVDDNPPTCEPVPTSWLIANNKKGLLAQLQETQ